jgi:hypothetical protein
LRRAVALAKAGTSQIGLSFSLKRRFSHSSAHKTNARNWGLKLENKVREAVWCRAWWINLSNSPLFFKKTADSPSYIFK